MNNRIAVITGGAQGIGQETARLFVANGWKVHSIDIVEPERLIRGCTYHTADVANQCNLPDIPGVTVLVNNAGIQTPTEYDKYPHTRDIAVNLIGLMNSTVKYALTQPTIQAVVNLASVSAHNGAEFGEYVASKGGVLAYTTWTAKQLAPRGATANSISFGGVLTRLNAPVTNDAAAWDEIMNQTPLRKWATAREAAEWIYFLAAVNKSCTGQDIIVDNGEMVNHRFVWR